MRRHLAFLLLAAWIGTIGVAEAQRQPPYWASIAAGQALMRTGPAQTYPATWLYVRPDLPIKVIDVRGDWRRVEDPDGAMGWMLVRLLSDQRSGIVRGQDPQPMHESASPAAAIRYRAEPAWSAASPNARTAGACSTSAAAAATSVSTPCGASRRLKASADAPAAGL
jgi:SH3-like domain-containing protein